MVYMLYMVIRFVVNNFCLFLMQPGPRDFPNQCLIKRNKKTSTFYLYLSLSPCKWLFVDLFLLANTEKHNQLKSDSLSSTSFAAILILVL